MMMTMSGGDPPSSSRPDAEETVGSDDSGVDLGRAPRPPASPSSSSRKKNKRKSSEPRRRKDVLLMKRFRWEDTDEEEEDDVFLQEEEERPSSGDSGCCRLEEEEDGPPPSDSKKRRQWRKPPSSSSSNVATPRQSVIRRGGGGESSVPPDDTVKEDGRTPSSSSSAQRRNYKGMSRQRRIEANARERTRVHTIGAAFEALRRAVPAYAHNQKLSKLAVLRIASAYIVALACLSDGQEEMAGNGLPECVESCTRTIQAEGRSRRSRNGGGGARE